MTTIKNKLYKEMKKELSSPEKFVTYSKKVTDYIQYLCNEGKLSSSLEQFDYPKGYMQINVGEISVILNTSNGRKEGMIKINGGAERRINNQYISIWKKYPLGRFLIRDFTKDFRVNDATPYYVIRFKARGTEYKVLLRKLLTDDDKALYTEITLDGNNYAIIKICEYDSEEPNTWLTYSPKVDIINTRTVELIHEIDTDKKFGYVDTTEDVEYAMLGTTDESQDDEEE